MVPDGSTQKQIFQAATQMWLLRQMVEINSRTKTCNAWYSENGACRNHIWK